MMVRFKEPSETRKGYCPCCGHNVTFFSYELPDFPCKRNSFFCDHCGSIARNRHVAKVILDLFPTNPPSACLQSFSEVADIHILNTCSSMAIHKALKGAKGYVVSEYWDNTEPGQMRKGVQSQNLMSTTFDSNSFDLVITEDILEHVADPKKACKEIGRILKPGGYHVATISVFWEHPLSRRRALMHNGKVKHLLPPVYHGDPNRPQGALVFVDFGADIVEKYCSVTGPTEIYWSLENREDEDRFAIFHNMVFVSKSE